MRLAIVSAAVAGLAACAHRAPAPAAIVGRPPPPEMAAPASPGSSAALADEIYRDAAPRPLPPVPGDAPTRHPVAPPLPTVSQIAPPIAPPPPPRDPANAPPAKPKADSPEALVALGDQYFEAGDLGNAKQLYTKALASPPTPIATYARYKLGWVQYNLGESSSAMQSFLEVAAAGDPTLRRAAQKDLALVYAEIGRADAAIPFFEHVARDQAVALVAQTVDHYLDMGKFADAITVLDALAIRDPAGACRYHLTAVKAALATDRDVSYAEAQSVIASHPSGDCLLDAERLLGELAWAYHLELPKSELDPTVVVRWWELAIAVSSGDRLATARHDLAVARWANATFHGGQPADWAATAEAFLDASRAPGNDDDAGASVDAWHNAIRAANQRGALPAALAVRARAGLAAVRGAAAPEARALAALVR